MSQSIGKVKSNGTLNDGSFYSIQDVDVLLENINESLDNAVTGINISDKIIYEGGTIEGLNITPAQLKEYVDDGKMVFLTVTSGIYNSTYTLSQLNMYDDNAAIAVFFRNSQVLTFEESEGAFVIT